MIARRGARVQGGTGEYGRARDRAFALEVAVRTVHVVRGAVQLGRTLNIVTVDDDVGGPYPPPARTHFPQTLENLGGRLEAQNADTIVAVYSDIRAWKGRPGLSAASKTRVRELVEQGAALVVLFGHPRLAVDLAGDNVLCAWGGEMLMQQAAAHWLARHAVTLMAKRRAEQPTRAGASPARARRAAPKQGDQKQGGRRAAASACIPAPVVRASWRWLLAALHLLLAWLFFEPQMHNGGDNSAYLALARSLVDGTGYREIYDPAMPLHTQYPPVFPLLLAGLLSARFRAVGPLQDPDRAVLHGSHCSELLLDAAQAAARVGDHHRIADGDQSRCARAFPLGIV